MDVMKFVSNNLFLIALAVVSGGLLIFPMLRGGVGGSAIDTLKATLLMNQQNALVLDVREEAEFAAGHIVNARNVPLGRLGGSSDVADSISKKKDRTIIVCCATGNRSAAAVAALKKMGFINTFNLAGGIGAWKQAGLPTQR